LYFGFLHGVQEGEGGAVEEEVLAWEGEVVVGSPETVGLIAVLVAQVEVGLFLEEESPNGHQGEEEQCNGFDGAKASEIPFG